MQSILNQPRHECVATKKRPKARARGRLLFCQALVTRLHALRTDGLIDSEHPQSARQKSHGTTLRRPAPTRSANLGPFERCVKRSLHPNPDMQTLHGFSAVRETCSIWAAFHAQISRKAATARASSTVAEPESHPLCWCQVNTVRELSPSDVVCFARVSLVFLSERLLGNVWSLKGS